MKKIFFIALVTLFISCDNTTINDIDTKNNAYYFEQLKESATIDTTLIRFVIGTKGNSAATGMCYCYPLKDSTTVPPKNTISNGTFIKLNSKPLNYYFMNTLQVFNKRNKNVIYFQADSVGESLYKIKITFPDTVAIENKVKVNKMDTLVFQATRKIITVNFAK